VRRKGRTVSTSPSRPSGTPSRRSKTRCSFLPSLVSFRVVSFNCAECSRDLVSSPSAQRR
jgi:hypothetical protein